ncbi:MAG: glycosyltransferase family 39 protein, partial [Anaerolineaceae bacterium]
MSLSSPQEKNHTVSWIWDVLLIIVMIAGVYFRFTGLLWGESQYLHPDERFLIWVGSDIEPAETISDYFNTQQSSLNPNNRGHGFYVYGTLPMFITRYAVEWIYGHSGFDEMTVVGRALSGTFDMLSVFMIYLIGKKLFDKRVGVIGAAFSALAVLQLQQSHFFTVDTFATFFVVLALYFVIRIATDKLDDPVSLPVLLQKETKEVKEGSFTNLLRHREVLGMSALFGLAVGMAASSKINTVLIAALLPLAYLIRWYRLPDSSQQKKMEYVVRDLVIAAMVAILAFRIFQPYAFAGPSFFNINLNPQWMSNMSEIQAQSSGDVDYPPALQWARRPITFSWQNLTLWGLGIPLGIVVWAGVIAMGWQLFKRDWKKYILLWGWTVAYFAWQSTASNSTMRYQLPIYPTLCLIGGWFVVYLYDQKLFHPKSKIPWRVIGTSVGLIAVIATAAWAFAFTRIYVEPITRIEATRWIFENVPGPINLMLSDEDGEHQQIISYPYDYQITEQSVFSANFTVDQDSILNEINFAKINELNPIEGSSKSLKITLTNVNDPFVNLFVGTITSDFSNPTPKNNDLYKVQITPPLMLEKGTPYSLKIELEGQGAVVINGSAVVNESTWDDGLPLRMDGYDPFGGIYQRDLSFEMYWDDNADKLDRFESLLNQADYLFISS